MSDSSVMTRIMNEWRRRGTSGADTSSAATPEEADAASDVTAFPDGASAMAGASLAMQEYRNLLREAPTDGVTSPPCSAPRESAENCSWLENGYVDPAGESDPVGAGKGVELPAELLDIEGMAGRPYREVARALVRNALLPQRPAILFCGESEARRTAARTASVLAGAARRRVLVIDASGEDESWIPAIAGMTKPDFLGMTAPDASFGGNAGGRGFEQVLRGECSLAEVLRRTSLANLRWMTSGRRREANSNFDLLGRLMRLRPKSAGGDRPGVGQIRKVLFPLKAAFDMLLVAAPPVGGDDFEALGGACDAAVQLVRMNSPARAARATADAIRRLGLLPAGCVMIES